MSSHGPVRCPLRFVFLLCCSELLWTALNCSRRFRGIDQEIFTNICKRVLAKTGGKDLIKVIPPMATKTLTYLIHFDTVFEYLWRPLFNRFMFTVFLHRVTQRQVFLQPLRITSIQWKMRRPETPVMLCQVLSAYWASWWCSIMYEPLRHVLVQSIWNVQLVTRTCSLWGGIAKSAPMAAHHTTSRFKKRVLVHACHLFVRARWIYNILQTNTNYILMTYSSEGQWRFQVEWLCLFSGCLTLRLAEAHRGNLCTLHCNALLVSFRFSRKLLKSPKRCEREVFG